MFPEWLLGMIVGALGSLLMWLLIGPLMSGRGLEMWIRKAHEGDERRRETLFTLFDELVLYATSREISTGQKVKIATDRTNDDGTPIYKEVDELLTPIAIISRSVGGYAAAHVKGFLGGSKTQRKAMMADAVANFSGSPEKALGIALEAALDGNYGPALLFLLERFKPNEANSGQGGWS